jgi:ATP-binding cassette, subfamily B, bacterial
MFSLTKYPHYRQLDAMDCGPTCLRMIAKYYGRSYSIEYLRERCYLDREGVSLLGISEGAELIGFRTVAVKVPFITGNEDHDETPSLQNVPLPCIAH